MIYLLAICKIHGNVCHCKRGRFSNRPKQKNKRLTMEAKMKKTIIRDTERNEELTLIGLRVEYEILKSAGETEAETFEDYLENITDKNGTCEWA